MEQSNDPELNLPNRLLKGLGRLALEVGKSFSYLSPFPNNGAIGNVPQSVKEKLQSYRYNKVINPPALNYFELRKRLCTYDWEDIALLSQDVITLETLAPRPQWMAGLDATRKDKRELRWLWTEKFYPEDFIDVTEYYDLGYKE